MIKRLLAYLHDRDLYWFRRTALKHSPILDRSLPRLTRTANRSVLWMGISALLWLAGGRRGRRAAVRGLLSIAISSAIANIPGKLLTRRARPLIDDVPLVRRLSRIPRSSSFPSGHSASALAFATGAALEFPFLAAPLVPLATAVAYSRVYTGVHYPSDVLAGALLGSAIGLATRSFWPLAPREASSAQRVEPVQLEPRERGDGVAIAVNSDAGSAISRSVTDSLREALPQARIDEIVITDGHELKEALESSVDSMEVIGVCGGDGSVNCAAQVAIDHKKPLMIVPGGTLNHLARDIGLENEKDAVEALKNGHAIKIDVGKIDDHVFLNTASFGAYTDLVDARESLESSIGKWPAVAIALIQVLRKGTPIEVEIDGERRKIWMIFIGNCRYHPSGFAPSWRERLDDGRLDIRILDGTAPWARTRLVASVLTGRLGRSRIFEQRLASRLAVRPLDGPIRLARDGETFDGSETFTVEKHSEPLTVFVPASAESDPLQVPSK